MNTNRLKEIGRKIMTIGGVTFMSGAGLLTVGSIIDYGERKRMYHDDLAKREKELLEQQSAAKTAKYAAEQAKESAIAEKIKKMDKTEFAKFKAEADAKASKEAIAEATHIKKAADNTIAQMKIECSNRIMDMESECAKKIEDVTEKYLEAQRKYEEINSLFTNRNEVLDAKRKLEKMTKKKASTERDLDELMDKLEELIDE